MMFFEGFGSVFPYIIYLSLIWVCLIFGLRTQILEAIRLSYSKNFVNENNTKKANDNIVIKYYDYSKYSVRSFIHARTEPRIYCFFFIVCQKIKRRLREIGPYKNSYLYSSYTHRGPPIIISR
jgi:hypothetical protein